ncbi:TonB-dependent receptor [Flavobacterium lacus]|uniref:Iron complex outermembrane receptor protein n=1 Tax=Flavobacterium lacus TaxID=1353778 RepID=A0A328WMM9_9FLAO|nr:TonB-dependent receptor plug domain-containing protein [Flavobacterium lacus]RAR46406.1 iron complex outermembrane receptor protein [Flavobacterium lacus]
MRYLIILFFLLWFGFSSYGQFTLSGKITNEKNQPLTGSHIHTKYLNNASNPIGEFEINGLPKGELRVYISYLGYKTCDTLVDITEDVVLNVKLKPSETNLEEITVKQKVSQVSNSLAEQQISKESMERNSSKTLAEALKEVSGVSLLKTGTSIVKPVINGLHSSRVPIFSNQVRLEDQQWGTEHAPNFDLNAAGKISVIKGASGLQYSGDAVGGMVVIESTNVKQDTLFGKTMISGSSNGRGGTISSSIHKGNPEGWRWNALGTLTYFGDREAPDYVLSNSGNRELNFSGDVSYVKETYELSAFYSLYNATIGILSASHIGNVTDLYNSINNQIPYIIDDFTYSIQHPKQAIQHHLMKLNYLQKLDESSSISTFYSLQFNKRNEFDLRRNNENKAALDLQLTTHSLQSDYKKEWTQFSFKTGISGLFQNNFANPRTGVRPLIPTYVRFDTGLYGIGTYEIKEDLVVDGGIRYDFSTVEATKYYLKSRWTERGYQADFWGIIVDETADQWLTKPQFTFHNISASVGVRKDFQQDWKWLNNISLSNRNPNPSEFFSDGLHHSTGQIELGDLRLKREESIKFSSSLSKKWNVFSMEVNPYFHQITNFMYLRPVGFETTIRGAFPVWEFQQTNARLFGLDFHSQWNIHSNWQHKFSFAYVNGEDLSENQPLIDMPPMTISTSIQYKKEEWNGLLLELQSESVFRQHRYPDFNFETDIIVDGEFVPVIVDISTPPKAYQLFHFYSEMKFKAFKKLDTTIALSVQNLLNTDYRDYLNRQRFFVDEMGRNIQLQLKINY